MVDRDIHFLGMHPSHPQEMEIGQLFPDGMVRGMDTSAPFNFAYGMSKMEDGGAAPRPDGYFVINQKHFPAELIYAKVEYLKGLLG
jgi:hypothetical protein